MKAKIQGLLRELARELTRALEFVEDAYENDEDGDGPLSRAECLGEVITALQDILDSEEIK